MVVTKENLLNLIARETREDIHVVRRIYTSLERIVFEKLSSVKPDTDTEEVEIRLFKGITMNGKYVPERTRRLNYLKDDSDEVTIKENIKVKPKITRDYQRKLSERLASNL